MFGHLPFSVNAFSKVPWSDPGTPPPETILPLFLRIRSAGYQTTRAGIAHGARSMPIRAIGRTHFPKTRRS